MDIKKEMIRNVPDLFSFFAQYLLKKTFHCLHGCQDDCLKCALYHCITVTDVSLNVYLEENKKNLSIYLLLTHLCDKNIADIVVF